MPQQSTLAMLFPRCLTCGHEIETTSEHYDSDPYAGSGGTLYRSECGCSWGEGNTEERADDARETASVERSDVTTDDDGNALDWMRADLSKEPKSDSRGWVRV